VKLLRRHRAGHAGVRLPANRPSVEPVPVDGRKVDDPTATQIGYQLMALEVNDIVAANVGSTRTI